MQAHTVRSAHPRPSRKRIGRGDASGRGTYSGRGLKGQKARSGGGVRPGFEGGQNPQIQGLPKLRGFKNRFRVEYQVVNVDRLATLPESLAEVDPSVLAEHRLIRHANRPVKVLAYGDISRALIISGAKVSAAAKAKIEKAGGSVQEA